MSSPIIVALDFDRPEAALHLAQQLNPTQCRLKVGKELFTRSGAGLIEQLHQLGFEVFLDLKFHDIPNTVAKACKAAADLGVWMVNVHAMGGIRMMSEARNILEGYSQRPKLIAVTLLTSSGAAELYDLGIDDSPINFVSRMAALAQRSLLDGVVCSAMEAAHLKRQFGNAFQLITPGIRPASSSQDDQLRIMTPTQALQAGSDYLVIGRPITRSPHPLAALEAIVLECNTRPTHYTASETI